MSEIYKASGVDVEAGYESVQRIKKHIAGTAIPGVIGGLGGFGALFSLENENYKEPVLVSGTDGVGTKILIAEELNKHDTVGIDLVAMCVNDILTNGAKPLFFLDYLSIGKQNPDKIEQIIKGIADGCVQAGCALIGGEMAEHPGMLRPEDYDIGGFAVGIAEKSEMITGENISEGDVIIGIPSSGVHSNGFSLIRKIIRENNLSLTEFYPELNDTLGNVLLTPTKIYVKEVLEFLKHVKPKGMCHITGGGFKENVPRIIPKGLKEEIDLKSWAPPPIFKFLSDKGKVDFNELYGIFNLGIGFIIITDKNDAQKALNILEDSKIIGYVVKDND